MPSETGFNSYNRRYIEAALWRGESCASIARDLSATPRSIRAVRDELFAPLASNPDAVKSLANGPMLNAYEINRPKAARKRRKDAPTQTEMFPDAESAA